jgi:hypothetical protein
MAGMECVEETAKRWRISIRELMLGTAGFAVSIFLIRFAGIFTVLVAGFVILGGSIGALAECLCSSARNRFARGFITGCVIVGAMIVSCVLLIWMLRWILNSNA